MISHLQGKLAAKSPTEIILDVHGVGFQISIPLSTFEKLGELNGQTTILTYLHVREDALLLYGFATEAERELFRHLLSVSGIGPKMAQAILSGLKPVELQEAIVTGNLHALTSISGVGRKTAERIVLELRHKLGKMEIEEPAVIPSSAQLKIRSEAMVALMSLGYTRAGAEQALRSVISSSSRKDLSVEELIKQALQQAKQ
jgi:Holliday junction DNA helicase RuvA